MMCFNLRKVALLSMVALYVVGGWNAYAGIKQKLIACFSKASSSCEAKVKRLDVVIDLDGTLVYSIHSKAKQAIEVRSVGYGLAHGAVEFLAALQRQPYIRISFFSAGEGWRNKPLVKQLGALVFKETGVKLKFKVFSKGDLSLGQKDLSIIRKKADLSHTLLVDDHRSLPSDQEQNLILLSEESARCQSSLEGCQLNQLVFTMGLILYSWGQFEENGIPILDTIKRFRNSAFLNSDEEILSLGLHSFRQVNPQFELR